MSINPTATPEDRISLYRLRRNGLRAIRYEDLKGRGVRHGWIVSEHANETVIQLIGEELKTHVRGDDRRLITDYVPPA